MKVGLLGGTFNPPHIGHLVCAQEARAQLGLDEILLLPVRAPPHKEARGDPGAEHRAALCDAAVAGEDGLGVCRLELELAEPSYTVSTLSELHVRRPGDELTFLVGGDMAASLPTWREPAEIVRLARLGVAERGQDRRRQIVARLRDVPGACDRADFFDMPRLDVSSTDLRARFAAGRPVRWLVPDAVAAYVRRHGIYGAAA